MQADDLMCPLQAGEVTVRKTDREVTQIKQQATLGTGSHIETAEKTNADGFVTNVGCEKCCITTMRLMTCVCTFQCVII